MLNKSFHTTYIIILQHPEVGSLFRACLEGIGDKSLGSSSG